MVLYTKSKKHDSMLVMKMSVSRLSCQISCGYEDEGQVPLPRR